MVDDATVPAESLDVLVIVLEAPHEEAELLGLEVSRPKTKVQLFRRLSNETLQYVHACGEDVEISESFTYFGSKVHKDMGEAPQEAFRWLG